MQRHDDNTTTKGRTMHVTINAGHTEYMPRGYDESLVVATFNAYDLVDRIIDTDERNATTWDAILHDDDFIEAHFMNAMSMDLPDNFRDDLTWATFFTFDLSLEQLHAWLDDMIGQISNMPGGDDDTFDYWPSGCRMTMEFAAYLDSATQSHLVEKGLSPDTTDRWMNEHKHRAARVIRVVRDAMIAENPNYEIADHSEWPDAIMGIEGYGPIPGGL